MYLQPECSDCEQRAWFGSELKSEAKRQGVARTASACFRVSTAVSCACPLCLDVTWENTPQRNSVHKGQEVARWGTRVARTIHAYQFSPRFSGAPDEREFANLAARSKPDDCTLEWSVREGSANQREQRPAAERRRRRADRVGFRWRYSHCTRARAARFAGPRDCGDWRRDGVSRRDGALLDVPDFG